MADHACYLQLEMQLETEDQLVDVKQDEAEHKTEITSQAEAAEAAERRAEAATKVQALSRARIDRRRYICPCELSCSLSG